MQPIDVKRSSTNDPLIYYRKDSVFATCSWPFGPRPVSIPCIPRSSYDVRCNGKEQSKAVMKAGLKQFTMSDHLRRFLHSN